MELPHYRKLSKTEAELSLHNRVHIFTSIIARFFFLLSVSIIYKELQMQYEEACEQARIMYRRQYTDMLEQTLVVIYTIQALVC